MDSKQAQLYIRRMPRSCGSLKLVIGPP